MIIDGNKISNNVLDDIKNELIMHNYKPRLEVILLGDNHASILYVKKKKEACEKIGIIVNINKLSIDSSEEYIIDLIKTMNLNNLINGIIVQLPLPKNLNEEKILNNIDYFKDVDGFHVKNIGELALNNREPTFIPCTVLSCLKIFENINLDLVGKNIVIIGNSNIVGIPLSLILLKKKATVTVCHINTLNLQEHTKYADILISACGQPEIIKKEYVKKDSIIIDIGINYTNNFKKKLVGDVDFIDVKDKVKYITPVPGGVGPITVSMLLLNTLKAFKLQNLK
tara:strand:- start:105 stop:953 length:849 start_codon:yes stop_codon:yes gene_type:complete